MINIILFAFTFLIATAVYGQAPDSNWHPVKVKRSVKKEVERNISNAEFPSVSEKIFIYNNRVLADIYRDDSLVASTPDSILQVLFKSYYLWKNDTLYIVGMYGLFGGSGFSLRLVNDSAILRHVVLSDELPSYSYTSLGSLESTLEISCTETEIVLSDIPKPGEKDVIYGYVEFKSGEYYGSRGTYEDAETLPRVRFRVNMKIYFKAGLLEKLGK